MIALAALLAAAPPPIVAYAVDPKHRIVEGIAGDGRDLWLSSLLDRVILRCRATCAPAFTLDGPGLPLGIAWDSKRQWLWVAMHCPEIKGVAACEGEVRAVDRSGRVRFGGRPSPGFRPGDLSIDKGVVTVSDSANGAVYRIENGRFSTIVKPGVGKSGQGSARLADGRTLVADYSQGIAAIAADGARTILQRADGRPIRGIDGMAKVGERLFAVYNGQSPGMLVELSLAGQGIAYTQMPDGGLLPDPTHAAWHRGSLYVVGDSGWATIEQRPTRPAGATIVRFTLPKSGK